MTGLDKYKASRLFKIYNGVTETKQNREFYEETIESGLMVNPSNLMTYWDKIPNGSPSSGGLDAIETVKNLTEQDPYFYFQKDETTIIPVLRKWILAQLESCGEGSPKSFRLMDGSDPVKFIIPLNFYKDVYTYHIYTQEGYEIPFGLANWTLDCYSGVLTFYGELPDGVDAEHPPLITCYQYTGGTGYRKDSVGFEGIVLPITDFQIDAKTFSTSGVEKNLLQSMKDVTDKIDKNYIDKYGWDGADDNEGVALGFEKIIPLKYSDTKDVTKGYDDSANSEIGSVISRKKDLKLKANKVLSTFTESEMPARSNRPWTDTDYFGLKVALITDGSTWAVDDLEENLAKLKVSAATVSDMLLVEFDEALCFEVDETTGVYGPNANLKKALKIFAENDAKIIFQFKKSNFKNEVDLSSLKENSWYDDLNTKVFGLELYSITDIKNLCFSKYKYLYVDSPALYRTHCINSLIQNFFVKEEDRFETAPFDTGCRDIVNIWINTKKQLNVDSDFKFFETIPSSLNCLYVYDSYFNLIENISEDERPYLTALSSNSSFPLRDEGYSIESEETEWLGNIEYINERTPINSEFRIIVRAVGGKKLCSVFEGETESKVLTFNPDTDNFVTLTTPVSRSIIVLDPKDVAEDISYSFKVRETDPYVTLWYWDAKNQKYNPFLAKESRKYDFGFPVVSSIGKIPPSLYFDSTDILNFSKDEVLSDYYGNRVFTKVLATEETPGNKSADFVVKAKETYYLDQYLQALYKEDPNFEGSIYLREGTYACKNNSLIIPPFKSFKLFSSSSVVTHLNIKNLYISNVQGAVNLEGIDFGEECTLTVDDSNLKAVSLNSIRVKDIKITHTKDHKIFLRDFSFNELTLSPSTKSNPKDLGDGTYDIRLENLTLNKITVNCDKVYMHASAVKEASFNSGKTFVSGCAIRYVDSKSYGTQIEGCDVREWNSSIDTLDIPSDENFLMCEKLASGQMYHRYTSFADPFHWNREERRIEIKLDEEVLYINDKGQITTNLKATDIALNPADYTRADTAVDPDTGKIVPVTATTLKEGLQDLFLNKADLIKGKVPLKQLPDSVAYGGLHYCGVWAFDDHNGKYPTFEDMTIDLSVEDHIKELQPGYFFIINPPKSELEKAQNDDTYSPARKQIAEDGEIYTAGDWMVYVGKTEKSFKVFDWSKAVTFRFDDYVITNKNMLQTLGQNEIFQVLTEETKDDLDNEEYGFLTIKKGIVQTNSAFVDSVKNSLPSGTNIAEVIPEEDLEATFTEKTEVSIKFEKIDRAYQDAAYAILPALDPDGKNWDWRNFGDGWLDFGAKTITEAFDILNEFIKNSLPRKGLTINNVKFKSPHLEAVQVYELNRTSLTFDSKKKDLYLVSQNELFEPVIEIDIDEIDNWKNYIYFGDQTVFGGSLNGQSFVNKELTKDSSTFETEFGSVKIEDIHINENVGQGFWKGLQPKFNFKSYTPGDYEVRLALSGKPEYEEMDLEGSRTFNWHIDEEPYRLGDAYLTVTLKPKLEELTNVFYLSGVPYIEDHLTANFTFRLVHALKNFVCDRDFVKVETVENGEILTKNLIILDDKVEGFEDYNDALVEVGIRVDAQENEKLNKINFKDIKLLSSVENTFKVFEFSVDKFPSIVKKSYNESERVYSGDPSEDYPIYNPKDSNSCGSEYNSQKLLSAEGYKGELQKVLVTTENGDNLIYRLPKEEFNQLSYISVNYTGIPSAAEYRWATFDKFGGEEVKLDSSNGFMLKLNPANEEAWKSKYNYSTGAIQDVKIFVKIYDEENNTETPWFDVNKAFNFYENPNENGAGVSYAGKSDWTQRRVTFGQFMKTGKIIVRIGLKTNSDLEFFAPTIEKIV